MKIDGAFGICTSCKFSDIPPKNYPGGGDGLDSPYIVYCPQPTPWGGWLMQGKKTCQRYSPKSSPEGVIGDMESGMMDYKKYGSSTIFTEEEAKELVKKFPEVKMWKTLDGEGILATDEEWEKHHSISGESDQKKVEEMNKERIYLEICEHCGYSNMKHDKKCHNCGRELSIRQGEARSGGVT